MIAYDRRKPLISTHISKTGGTSFRRNLEAWFGRRLFLHYMDEVNQRPPPRVNLRAFPGWRYKRDLCIHGHFNMNIGLGIEAYYPEVDQFVTWLRDPVELQISLFSHQLRSEGGALYKVGDEMRKTTDIDEFFAHSRCPYFRKFPRRVTAENLQQQVDTLFVHIGVLEQAEASLRIVAEKLGRKLLPMPHENVTPRTVRPSESAIRAFREKCALECQLHEQMCRLNR